MGGSDTSIVSSLNFNSGNGGDARASLPELPEYLGILGGPIRSFRDDDEDLGSLEFTFSREEGNQSGPEGDVQEIRRDGENMA